jgi:hypothetical protein
MRKLLFLLLSMLLPLAAWSADDSPLIMETDAFNAGGLTEMIVGQNNVPPILMVTGDEETVAIGDPIALNPQSGSDLSTVLSEAMATNPMPQSISITLAAGGQYTVSAPLNVSCSLSIVGAGPELAVIDASALENAMILMTDLEESSLNEQGFYPIGDMKLANVCVKNLTRQLFYANKAKYLIPNFIIDNSVIQVAGGNKTVIDTNSGGVIGKLSINNSTIYGNPAHEGQLYSSQSGQKATDAGLEVQTLSLQNSTFYNIALNKNVCTHRSANQTWLAYDVQNCLVVDCGKSSQFIKGLNGGQSGKNPIWTVKHNSFQRTDESGAFTDSSAEESTGDEDEPVQDNVVGVVVFSGDIAAGDFTMAACPQNSAKIGDPRWINESAVEEIFIEVDVTDDFDALTQYTNWVGASGYATWAAPKVMTNAGDEVYMCERYDGNCDYTGDVMYQTVTGLTPGKYRIELYGSAAYTFGRGFDSGAFTSDETPEEPLMENTGITLYAESTEGTVSQEIAAYKATTFSEVSTALLDNVVVGEDGSVKLGMNKSTNYTNWHIIQLKGVTALVNAHEYWMKALADAEEVAAMPMNGEVLAALRATMVDDSGFKTAEDYIAALDALQKALADAQNSISVYAATAEALALYGEKAAALDEAGQAAYDVSAIQAGYDGRTMTEDMSGDVKAIYIAAVKAQTTPGADMTDAGSKEIGDWIGSTGAYNSIYAERFGQEMGEGDIMYQTITGMQQGTYKVELYAVASQAWNEAATGDGITEAYANDATAPLTVIAQTACDPAESVVTLEGYVDENGELTMGMRNLTNGGNWFVIQLKSISLVSLGENSINELTVSPFDGAEGIYNLNGQKVDTPTRGIYIVNGKKVVVK